MIEYRIEMLIDGKWKRAKYPFSGNVSQHIATIEEAKYRLFRLKNAWAFAWKKLPESRKKKIVKPQEWKIVKRETSDWEETE